MDRLPAVDAAPPAVDRFEPADRFAVDRFDVVLRFPVDRVADEPPEDVAPFAVDRVAVPRPRPSTRRASRSSRLTALSTDASRRASEPSGSAPTNSWIAARRDVSPDDALLDVALLRAAMCALLRRWMQRRGPA